MGHTPKISFWMSPVNLRLDSGSVCVCVCVCMSGEGKAGKGGVWNEQEGLRLAMSYLLSLENRSQPFFSSFLPPTSCTSSFLSFMKQYLLIIFHMPGLFPTVLLHLDVDFVLSHTRL